MKKEIFEIENKIFDVQKEIKMNNKNKKIVNEKYEKKINKFVDNKIDFENEIDKILKKLNEKENLIYNIQKLKIDNLKFELNKYFNIINQFEKTNKKLENEIILLENKLKNLNIKSLNKKEEFKNSQIKIENYKNEQENFLNKFQEIKENFPNDFNFIQKNINLQKEIIEL